MTLGHVSEINAMSSSINQNNIHVAINGGWSQGRTQVCTTYTSYRIRAWGRLGQQGLLIDIGIKK